MFLYSRRAQEVLDLVSKTLLSGGICGCDLSVLTYSCRAQVPVDLAHEIACASHLLR